MPEESWREAFHDAFDWEAPADLSRVAAPAVERGVRQLTRTQSSPRLTMRSPSYAGPVQTGLGGHGAAAWRDLFWEAGMISRHFIWPWRPRWRPQ